MGAQKSAKLNLMTVLYQTATLSGWTVPPAKMSPNEGLFEVTGRLKNGATGQARRGTLSLVHRKSRVTALVKSIRCRASSPKARQLLS